ncbi:MAG: hypothetical protein ABIQ15_05395, partial [Nocardioides sp.]
MSWCGQSLLARLGPDGRAHGRSSATDNVRDFPDEVTDTVGIELLNADALLGRLVTAYPSKMLAVHRSAVASLTGATGASTLRRPELINEARYRDDVPEDFVIARNAEPGSTLPYLLRIPLGDGIILKAKDTWPRTGKVYCHRVEEWPADAEIIERVRVRSCVRRGAAIDLVLDRGRENRSQIVVTNARGRQMIFWQTARTSKQARPAV